jgi:hypothetical protein
VPVLGKLSGILLLTFVPGYFFCVFILKIKNSFYHLLVFSAVFSFIFTPLITLPLALVVGQATKSVIIVSIALFSLACFIIGRKTSLSFQIGDNAFPSVWSLIVVAGMLVIAMIMLSPSVKMDISSAHFYYPHSVDLTYLRAIVVELSKNIPPYNPEASFSSLNQTWGFWYFYTLMYNLTNIPIYVIFHISSFYLTFIVLNLVNIFAVEFFKNSFAGIWSILLLVDSASILFFDIWNKIIIKLKSFLVIPAVLQQEIRMPYFFPYITSKSYYMSPAVIMIILCLFLILKFLQERQKSYLYLTFIVLSTFPFFHAGYYLVFLSSVAALLLWQLVNKKLELHNLLYLATPLPFYFLYVRCYVSQDSSLPPPFQLAFHPERLFWMYKLGIILPILALLAYKYVHRDKRVRQIAIYLSVFAVAPVILSVFTDNIQFNGFWYVINYQVAFVFLATYTLITIRSSYSKSLFKGVVFLIVIPVALYFMLTIKKAYRDFQGEWVDNCPDLTTAGNWIKTQTNADDVFLVIPDSPSIKVVLGGGDRRVAYGYTLHIFSARKPDELKNIRHEIKTIYCAPNEEVFYKLCRKYRVNYIFVGEYERTVMEDCPDKYEWNRDSNLVFQNEKVSIYRALPSAEI